MVHRSACGSGPALVGTGAGPPPGRPLPALSGCPVTLRCSASRTAVGTPCSRQIVWELSSWRRCRHWRPDSCVSTRSHDRGRGCVDGPGCSRPSATRRSTRKFQFQSRVSVLVGPWTRGCACVFPFIVRTHLPVAWLPGTAWLPPPASEVTKRPPLPAAPLPRARPRPSCWCEDPGLLPLKARSRLCPARARRSQLLTPRLFPRFAPWKQSDGETGLPHGSQSLARRSREPGAPPRSPPRVAARGLPSGVQCSSSQSLLCGTKIPLLDSDLCVSERWASVLSPDRSVDFTGFQQEEYSHGSPSVAVSAVGDLRAAWQARHCPGTTRGWC